MELRHLRYFIAVAKEQSVSRAAESLYLSQPALSRQIRDLEVELGASLFHRSPNSLRLSEAGRFFQSEAQALLRRSELATGALKAFVRSKSFELRIGYCEMLTMELRPPLLRLLKLHAPQVRPILQAKLSQDIFVGLGKRIFDVGLTVKPRLKVPRSLQFETLREFRVGILVPQGHRFVGRETVSPREIVNEPLVIFSKKNNHYQRFLGDTLRSTQKRPRINLECDSPANLMGEIASGRSIAVLFEPPAKARKHLVFIPFTKEVPSLHSGILYRSGEQNDALADFIRVSRMLISKQQRR